MFKKETFLTHPWFVGPVCTLLGVFGGYWVAIYQDSLTSTWQELNCRGMTRLAEGKLARGLAVKWDVENRGRATGVTAQNIEAKHKEANAAFEASKKCGVAEAGAFLGQAYCYGWGMKADSRLGWTMIREAVRNDPKLGSEWFSSDIYCPNAGQ